MRAIYHPGEKLRWAEVKLLSINPSLEPFAKNHLGIHNTGLSHMKRQGRQNGTGSKDFRTDILLTSIFGNLALGL